MTPHSHKTRDGDRGVEGIAARLRDEANRIASLERRRAAMTKRRRLLMLKLRTAGWSERRIAAEAGISDAGVHQALVVAEREQREREREQRERDAS